jgi:hypothetical protein
MADNDHIDEFGFLDSRDKLEYSFASFFADGVWPASGRLTPPPPPDRRSVGFADAINSEILADDTFFAPPGYPLHPSVAMALPVLGVSPMDTVLDGEMIALADVAFSAPSSPPFVAQVWTPMPVSSPSGSGVSSDDSRLVQAGTSSPPGEMLSVFGEAAARATEIASHAVDMVGLSPGEGNFIAQPTPLSENVFDVSEIATLTSQATAVHDMMHCAALWLQNVNVSGVPAPIQRGICTLIEHIAVSRPRFLSATASTSVLAPPPPAAPASSRAAGKRKAMVILDEEYEEEEKSSSPSPEPTPPAKKKRVGKGSDPRVWRRWMPSQSRGRKPYR